MKNLFAFLLGVFTSVYEMLQWIVVGACFGAGGIIGASLMVYFIEGFSQ